MKEKLIDTHVHILPGIDDGPASLEDAIKMASIAERDGIGTMIATPHCLNGIHSVWKEEIISVCEEFNRTLKERDVDLKVLPGSEAHLSIEILEELEQGRLMTLNDTGKYLFIELPDQFIGANVIGLINQLKSAGITPIITHPERNPAIQKGMNICQDFVFAGALMQITASSIAGGFGKAALKCTKKILEQDMIHLIASDAHSTKSRPPILSDAFKKLSSIWDEDSVNRIFFENPEKIINGESIKA